MMQRETMPTKWTKPKLERLGTIKDVRGKHGGPNECSSNPGSSGCHS